MPAQTSGAYLKRYLTIFMLAIVLIVPSMIITTETNGSNGDKEAISPTRAPLDIRVDGIEVRRTSQSNNIYPGQRVEIWVKLIHDERPIPSVTPITQNNPFTTILVIDDTFDNVTTIYETVGVSRSMTTNYTGKDPVGQGPNPPFVVRFFYQVPDRPPKDSAGWDSFQFRMHATITVDDDDKSDNYASGSGLRVSEPKFAPFIFEDGQKEPGTIGPVHTVDVGDPVNIKFKLQNRGQAVDNIGINILQAPEGWKVGGFEPITIYPNDEEELDLFVQIPNNPLLAQADETYSIVARAFSEFYPSGPYETDPSHTFRVEIRFKPGVKITPALAEGQNYKAPGREHEVFFEVENIGNGEDTYTLESSLDEIHVKKGWYVSKPNPMMPELKPGANTLIKVEVFIPADAAKFYNVNIYLSAISSRSGGNYKNPGTQNPMLIFASTIYAGDIEEPDDEGYLVTPGKVNTINFNFTNMGNDKDPDQTIQVFRKPIGWGVDIDLTPIKASKGLGPRTTTMITMNVFVKETELTTERTQRPKLVLKAYGGPFDPQLELDTEIFEFNIPPTFKLDLSSPEPEKEGFIGGQVDYIINVRNAGNWIDGFNLSVDNEWAELEDEFIEIAPDEVYPIKLTIDIPRDAAADTNPDTPYPIDPQKNWYDGYKIRVRGYSDNGTSIETLKTIELILHVQPFYDFTMEVAPDENPLKFSTDHDQNRAVKVMVNNTGNIADLVRLDWEDNPYDWLRLQNTYVDIPDDGSAFAVININPRKGDVQETGIINVTLQGFSKNDPDQETQVNLPISLEFYRMGFDFVEAKMNDEIMLETTPGELGRRYSFQVNITNVGSTDLDPTRFGRLYVVLYDGPFEVDRANISYLPVGDYTEVLFAFTIATPGPHVLRFELEGDIPISESYDIAMQKTLIVAAPNIKEPEDDTSLPLWAILFPVLLAIIFVTMLVVFIVKYNQIYISPIETGYDEDGEYRPWAVKEKMKGEEKKELEAPKQKEALPEPEKPGLPPGPSQPQPTPPQAGGTPQPQQVRAGPMQMSGRPAPGQPMPQRPPAQQGARPPMPPQQRGAMQPTRPGQNTRPPMQPTKPGQ